MQNIDYSRRLRGKSPSPGEAQSYQPAYTSYSRESSKPKSAFILLIGAILLFTSGMVVGIQLNQKENKFQEQGEKSFANLGKSRLATETLEKESKYGASVSEESSLSSPTRESNSISGNNQGASSPFPATLKYPPKNDQINYMVQIGDFTPEDAISFGKSLLDRDPSLKGRIFRTSTGKLFAGYYYRMDEAKETLEKLKEMFPNLSEAQVKTIRF
jgi:hypothetical protein